MVGGSMAVAIGVQVHFPYLARILLLRTLSHTASAERAVCRDWHSISVKKACKVFQKNSMSTAWLSYVALFKNLTRIPLNFLKITLFKMEPTLQQIAARMVAKGKGILAADESNPTAGKRLASIKVESTPDSRRQYREIFLGTEGIEKYLSGVILYDETIRQNMSVGISFVEHLQNIGVIPGIKVDMGIQDLPNFPGEKYTQGLDNLGDRLKEYHAMGARFAKWRSVLTVSNPKASEAAMHTNAHGMCLYASLCQQAGIVPIVEPEVLIDGEHTIEQSYEVTKKTLEILFGMLKYFKVDLSGLILKSSMVISGKSNTNRASAKTVGEMTYKCLLETVPNTVPGVVFLSGGQTPEEATENLYEINVAAKNAVFAPWELTYSYARALQGPSLAIWNGHDENLGIAREKFIERLKANSSARMGEKVGNGVGAKVSV